MFTYSAQRKALSPQPMVTSSVAGRLVTLLERYLDLSKQEAKAFGSHSLRRGGATYYSNMGLSNRRLQTLGRWKSHAFELYTETLLDKTNAELAAVLAADTPGKG
jgi:hypothetical protein